MIIVGQEKPSLDELSHFGVKGMHWGQHRSRQRELNKQSRANDRAERNSEIEAARSRIRSGQNRQDLKDAKAQFKVDKKVIGRREAKKKLVDVRVKNFTDEQVASQVKTGAEMVGAVLGVVGGVVLSSLITTRAKNLGLR